MKHQYRVILTIQDDFNRKKDLCIHSAFPSHKTLAEARKEYEMLRKVIDDSKLKAIEERERRLLVHDLTH